MLLMDGVVLFNIEELIGVVSFVWFNYFLCELMILGN